jgi:hypothetical protein
VQQGRPRPLKRKLKAHDDRDVNCPNRLSSLNAHSKRAQDQSAVVASNPGDGGTLPTCKTTVSAKCVEVRGKVDFRGAITYRTCVKARMWDGVFERFGVIDGWRLRRSGTQKGEWLRAWHLHQGCAQLEGITMWAKPQSRSHHHTKSCRASDLRRTTKVLTP